MVGGCVGGAGLVVVPMVVLGSAVVVTSLGLYTTTLDWARE